MRLTRGSAGDLRRDPALLADATRAQGFFPGQRVAFVEDAGDGATAMIGAALVDWRAGDAVIVVTAGALAAKSSLRKLFETHPAAVAIGLYDDPPSRAEIEADLARAGLPNVPAEAMADLVALSRAIDPGDFRQTVEKIALYKRGDATPLTAADIAACAPATLEAEVDDLIDLVAEGQMAAVSPLLKRLEGQGTTPVTLCIMAMRHFRALHSAASDPGGAVAGLARARPPVFGPRRARMAQQAQGWGLHRLEEALDLMIATDLTLRSASRAPVMAVMERALIRLANLAKR